MGVANGGSTFMRIRHLGEGVVIVLTEVGTELVLGKVSKVFVFCLEVSLRFL